MKNKFLLLFVLITVSTVVAQEKTTYFYHGYNYGTQSIIDPFRLILNGGYGILQADNRPNRPFDIQYKNGWNNVMDNLGSPFKVINDYGWGKFFTTEILPFSIDSGEAYYWPNYTMHLLGGGMSYRMMQEWYTHYNFKYPRLWSFGTLTVYHLLNEVVENNEFKGYNVDPIADVYIFNHLGMLLFSSDKVANFFSNTLNYSDWSYQVSFNPDNKAIMNNGQNFSMKYKFTQKLALFYYYGNHGEFGLSYYRNSSDCISFGAGLSSNSLEELDKDSKVRTLKANLLLSGGIFYDRNNSLLASLIYTKSKDYKYRLNIYPGVIHIGKVSPGLFIIANKQNKISMGINIRFLPFGFGGY